MGMIWIDGRGGRRGRRNTAAGARVGLTDNLSSRDGELNGSGGPEKQDLSPRALARNARTTWLGFRRILGLVWEANPYLTASLGLLNIILGVVPALRVWLAKLLIDAVVAAVGGG